VRTLMPGRAVGAIAAALAVTVLAGCTIPAPEGQAPLRYRDEVFSAVNATTDITYGQAPDLQGNPVDLKLDLYQPAGDTVAKRPAYIWVHGGGFSHGDKSSGAGVASFFARLGYVAVSINYRLLAPLGCAGHLDPSAECRAAAIEAQHDAQAAVRWLRRNAAAYRIDPDRIAMGGGSAGAITSLLVGWRPEDPGSSGNPGFSSAIRAAVSVSGGVPQDEEGVITAGDAPALFIHGMEDRAVFYSWAVSNAVKMLHLGIPVIFEPIDGAGHNLPAEFGPLIREQSSRFLYYMLDLGHAAGQPASAGRAADRQMAQLSAQLEALQR
jgi:dienelactone hydrolase